MTGKLFFTMCLYTLGFSEPPMTRGLILKSPLAFPPSNRYKQCIKFIESQNSSNFYNFSHQVCFTSVTMIFKLILLSVGKLFQMLFMFWSVTSFQADIMLSIASSTLNFFQNCSTLMSHFRHSLNLVKLFECAYDFLVHRLQNECNVCW